MKGISTANVAGYRDAGLKRLSDPTRERVLPNVPPETRRILDVGCHAGHVLEALKLPEGCEVFGCDINAEAIELAKTCLPHASFVEARAEELPYEDSHFDFLFARGAALAFDIPKALLQFKRVLKPGGRLWMLLHRWKDVRFILKSSLRVHPIRTLLFGTYVLINSALFHYTGKLIRYPLNRSRIMTFQTEKRMRRELRKAGFVAIQVSGTNFFVMEADKIGPLLQVQEVEQPHPSMTEVA